MKSDNDNITNRKITGRNKLIKIITIASTIVLYIAILNIVSHARGSLQYEVEKDSPLADAERFVSFAGDTAASGVLIFSNSAEGNAVGYSHNITLSGVEMIQVSFTVDCPPQYTGTGIIVDLYNPIVGYDFPEQEEVIVLKEGINEIAAVLLPGENAPEEAQLRLFTGNITDISAEHVEVYPLRQLPKVTPSMVVAVMIPFGVLLLEIIVILKIKGINGGACNNGKNQ